MLWFRNQGKRQFKDLITDVSLSKISRDDHYIRLDNVSVFILRKHTKYRLQHFYYQLLW